MRVRLARKCSNYCFAGEQIKIKIPSCKQILFFNSNHDERDLALCATAKAFRSTFIFFLQILFLTENYKKIHYLNGNFGLFFFDIRVKKI